MAPPTRDPATQAGPDPSDPGAVPALPRLSVITRMFSPRQTGLIQAGGYRQHPQLKTRPLSDPLCGTSSRSSQWQASKRTFGVTGLCPPSMAPSPTTMARRPLQRTSSRTAVSRQHPPVLPARETDTGRAVSGPAVPCRSKAAVSSCPGPPFRRSCAPAVHHPNGLRLRRDAHSAHDPDARYGGGAVNHPDERRA